MVEIINWIDKELRAVKLTTLFQKYFDGIELEKIEETFYLTSKQNGIGIIINNELSVTSIRFYSENYEGCHAFKENLLYGIEFSLSKNNIREMFGIPNRSGGGHRNLYLGQMPSWDRYLFDFFSLHIQYSIGYNSIDMITLGSLSLENYFNSGLQ